MEGKSKPNGTNQRKLLGIKNSGEILCIGYLCVKF